MDWEAHYGAHLLTGFFPPDALTGRPQTPLVPRCGLCRLFKGCKSPKMRPFGKGKRGILVVGESPGADEDDEGRPFVGKAGRKLQGALTEIGIDLDEDCWATNAAICHPPANKLPDKAVGWCRPTLTKTIEELKPSTVILLGGSAVKSLIGWLWREDVGEIGRWIGWQIPSQRINSWVCPAWHPSYVMRTEGQRDGEVTELIWKRHLKAACNLEGQPWKEVPDWAGLVEVELDPSKAARKIGFKLNIGGPVAFDFETDRLKPDHEDARIISCALADGKVAVAYPWHGEAVKATKELLESQVPKIGWSIKFEQRWAARFGIRIRNWVHDGSLAAHVLDNRRDICKLGFQSFVLLGVSDYKDETAQYMEAKGSNQPNRLRECPLDKLLLRNGLDALYEWHIGVKQMEQLRA